MLSARIPPLQTLRAFEAAVRLRSFTHAADELALTQGAVSQHVRALEARLGEKLFVREHMGVTPTPRAHALALQVRQGLTVLVRAFGAPAVQRPRGRTAAAPPVRLAVSVLPSFATRWLNPRLQRFHAAHPEVEVEVRPSASLARLDGRDRIDVALRYGPGQWPGLQSEKLMDEEIFPVVSPDYRSGKLPRRPSELARCTLLRHRSQPWEPWFQAARLEMTEPVTGPLFEDAGQVLDAAARGEGIALARRSLANGELAAGKLVRLWKASIIDVHAHFVVWRPDNAKVDAIDIFRRWLRSEVDFD
ncbi:LysR substrate-binding domain-containing protein [Paraburkholderia fungorum]|uniref:LysR substrate-binding domain-containing protein n=1 Tax=Paraburkholderia fungorum TaxID=134537 RepID=UPI0038B992AC